MPSPVRRAASRVKRRLRRLLGRPVPSIASDPYARPIPPLVASGPPGPTIVLVNDCRDQISFGSQSLADGLHAILARHLPTSTMLPVPSHWLLDPAQGLSGFIVDDGAGMVQPYALYPAVADQFETVAQEWLAGRGGPGAREVLDRLRRARLVVLNAEGSIYRTNMSAIRELFILWFAKTQLGVPAVFLNGSVHLTDVVAILPAMARKTFPVLDAIAVREPRSLANLEQYVPGVDARVVPDAAFAFAPDDARETEAVAALRARIGDSPYFCLDPGAMPLDTLGGDRSVLHQLVTRLRRLVPTAVMVSNMPADEYMAEIARATGSVYVDTMTDYREFLALLSGARFLVSGRHHNCILASVVGTPTIAFGSTTHKVHGACEMLEGLIGTPYDGTDLRGRLDEVEEQARGYLRDGDALRARLLDVSTRRRAGAEELGRLAAAALGAGIGAGSAEQVGDGDGPVVADVDQR